MEDEEEEKDQDMGNLFSGPNPFSALGGGEQSKPKVPNHKQSQPVMEQPPMQGL